MTLPAISDAPTEEGPTQPASVGAPLSDDAVFYGAIGKMAATAIDQLLRAGPSTGQGGRSVDGPPRRSIVLRVTIEGPGDGSAIGFLGAADPWTALLRATAGTPYRVTGYECFEKP